MRFGISWQIHRNLSVRSPRSLTCKGLHMPTPRKHIVDSSATGVYHCISRCVRRAFLCGDGYEHRKRWLERRMDFLVSLMAIELYAYQILSNHLHIVLRIRPDIVAAWTDREVVRRYLLLCPCKSKRRNRGIPVDSPPTKEEIDEVLLIPNRVQTLRERLSSISWFMAKLKEPIARRANREDDCKGRFWEGRFRSFAVLDDEAILAVSTYVDLNSVRAGIAERPEDSMHGSIVERIATLRKTPRTTAVKLLPIPGMTEKQYLTHVDQWARVMMPGSRATPADLPPILERLGLNRAAWVGLLKTGWDNLRGTAIGCHDSLEAEARRRNGSWVCNPLQSPPS